MPCSGPQPGDPRRSFLWRNTDHARRDRCAGSRAAWNAKPSWYVLATQDQTVPPDLQRFVSKRMKATTTEVASSHVPILSKPDVVPDVIRKAAGAVSMS